MTNHTTSVAILAFVALITGYDAFAVAFGWHASISECVTNGIHQSTIFAGIFAFCIGVLLGHWWFSTDYQNNK